MSNLIYIWTFLIKWISLCDRNPGLKCEFGFLADWWLIIGVTDSIWTEEDRSLSVLLLSGGWKDSPLLVETAGRCQMSYRPIMLTSPRAMGNKDWTEGREECVPIKRGLVFVFSQRMLILCYLQTSVTCSRQMPGVSRCGYSWLNCSHADCLGHVNMDAVNHCCRGLLLLVPRYIILTQPQEISHGAFTWMKQMDLIFHKRFLLWPL